MNQFFRISLVSFLLCTLGSPNLFAQVHQANPEPIKKRQLWKPEWPKFRPAEYVVTGVASLGAAYLLLIQDQASSPRWTGPILFDTQVRSSMLASSYEGRKTAGMLSDYLYVPNVGMLTADIVYAGASGNWDAAWQMSMMDLQAFSLSGLLAVSLEKGMARQRPSVDDCNANPNYEPMCNRGNNVSFPSGHTTSASTAAGLTCAHHLNMKLYGNQVADITACAIMIASASTTGSLRIVADRHYSSDVLAAEALGFLIGYLTPTWLHYTPSVVDGKNLKVGVMPWALPQSFGLQFLGWL